jgi:hypothetical protein
MLDPTPGEVMPVAPEVSAADVVAAAAGNVAVGQPEWSDVTGHHFGKISATSAARVVATAVMWMIVLAIITSV